MAFDNDLEFLRAAVPDLQQYILSKDLYWPLRMSNPTPGAVQIPQLTIGNLLLAQARLSALTLDASRSTERDELLGQFQQIREEWRSNWSMKAAHEFSSRLNLWQQYLRELRGERRAQAVFSNEVRQRAILSLLQPEILDGIPANEAEQLKMADDMLRSMTAPGSFVWDPEVEKAFPQEPYWFLYVSVRKS